MNALGKKRWASVWSKLVSRPESEALRSAYKHLSRSAPDEPIPEFPDLNDADRTVLAEHVTNAYALVAGSSPSLHSSASRTAASKKWWEDLRADPVRYAEFVESRRQAAIRGRRK